MPIDIIPRFHVADDTGTPKSRTQVFGDNKTQKLQVALKKCK